jgi:GNAT superfamily N-acetyltransferase
MPFVVDPLTPGDLEGALRLSTQAGWNQTAADWGRIFDLSPAGCLAGRLDGALVATATVASPGEGARWIGMVLVDESIRGRGLGSALFARILAKARDLGGDAVGLDATDLGRSVYSKQGFADVAPIDRWTGTLRSSGPGDDLRMIDRSTFDDVAELDRKACGIDRSALLLHLMHEDGAFGVFAPGSGFAFLRPGRTCSHVGPVVGGDDAACARMLSRLARLAGATPVLVDAPRSPESSALLERHGLAVVRKLTRMTFARPQKLLLGADVRAAVSFEWG